MPHQVALTIAAKVRADEVESLRQLLESMGDGVANGSVIDFAQLDGVHFARFVVLEETTDLDGKPLPALAALPERPRHLARAASGRARRPGGRGHRPALRPLRGLSRARRRTRDSGSRTCERHSDQGAGVLREHGRPLDGARSAQEAELRDRARGVPRRRRRPARARIRRRSGARCRSTSRHDRSLRWALEPPAGLDLRLRGCASSLHCVGVPLVLLLLLAAPRSSSRRSTSSLLRRHERTRPGAARASPARSGCRSSPRSRTTSCRTRSPRSASSSPALFRRLTLIGVLFAINYATRHVFNHGNLAGSRRSTSRAGSSSTTSAG